MRAALARALVAAALLRRTAGAYNKSGRIESARLYGNVNKYAYYFVDLLVGSPNPQLTTVIVDTGSAIVGFPCGGCGHCGSHIDPPFHVGRSDSLEWLNCSHELCSTGCTHGSINCSDELNCSHGPQHDHCSYNEKYMEGSSISGYWFVDYVQLGDVADRNPRVLGEMGCHYDENKLFYRQRANGIMGMAPDRSGPPTILHTLFADSRHVNERVFSMCLSEWGGLLTVGGYNASIHKAGADIQWISMLPLGYYRISPTRLTMEASDDVITLGSSADAFGTAIIDSGTTYTYLPGNLAARVKHELEAYCGAAENPCRAKRGTKCWQLDDSAAGPALFPTMFWSFGEHGARVRWDARAYLYHTGGSEGLWCDAFADNGDEHMTVLGISWMMFRDVVFDMDKGRVGVAEANCPQHVRESDFLDKIQTDFETDERRFVLGALGKNYSFAFYFGAVGLLLVFGFACHLRRCQRRARYEHVAESGGTTSQQDLPAVELSLLNAA